jgi:mannose-6-phosphate isomerase-like protein (cupin superfamily)
LPATEEEVSVSGFSVARLEDIEEISDGRCPWRPVRHHFGITSFGANAWTGKEPGDRIINEHDEAGEHEELYVVHSGRARFELDGTSVDAPAGTLVYAKPGVMRTAFAEEPNTTLVAVGGEPGKPYRPHGFEVWAPIDPLYKAGRYEEAADAGKKVADEYPQYTMVLCNVACCEALAGRTDDAIRHLQTAVAANEDVKKWAAEDADLDSLRDDPRFQELMG